MEGGLGLDRIGERNIVYQVSGSKGFLKRETSYGMDLKYQPKKWQGYKVGIYSTQNKNSDINNIII